MKSLVCLTILAGVVSCAPPSSTAKSGGEAPQAPQALQGGSGAKNGAAPHVTIQQADVNEDGEINALDVAAVSHYLGKKVPAGAEADAEWLFSSAEITIGESFWVRVDLPGEMGEQMDFTLENCGDFFLVGDDDGNNALVGEVHGSVGGLESLFIFSATGQKSPSASCSLRATAIKRADGSRIGIGSFTQSLNLRSARITLSNVDWSRFRNGIIASATVIVDKRAASPIKEYVIFHVCRMADDHNGCTQVGVSRGLELPDDGVLESLQLGADDDEVSHLPDGEYLLIVSYGTKGGG